MTDNPPDSDFAASIARGLRRNDIVLATVLVLAALNLVIAEPWNLAAAALNVAAALWGMYLGATMADRLADERARLAVA